MPTGNGGRREFLKAAAAAGISIGIAGCSGSGEDPSGSSGETQTVADTAQDTVTDQGAADAETAQSTAAETGSSGSFGYMDMHMTIGEHIAPPEVYEDLISDWEEQTALVKQEMKPHTPFAGLTPDYDPVGGATMRFDGGLVTGFIELYDETPEEIRDNLRIPDEEIHRGSAASEYVEVEDLGNITILSGSDSEPNEDAENLREFHGRMVQGNLESSEDPIVNLARSAAAGNYGNQFPDELKRDRWEKVEARSGEYHEVELDTEDQSYLLICDENANIEEIR